MAHLCLCVHGLCLSSTAASECLGFSHGSGLRSPVPWEWQQKPNALSQQPRKSHNITYTILLVKGVAQAYPVDNKGSETLSLNRIKEQVGPETLLQPFLDSPVYHRKIRWIVPSPLAGESQTENRIQSFGSNCAAGASTQNGSTFFIIALKYLKIVTRLHLAFRSLSRYNPDPPLLPVRDYFQPPHTEHLIISPCST